MFKQAVLFSLLLSFFMMLPSAFAENYDPVEGEVTTSLPPSPTEIWVSGMRILSGGGAKMIYEDGSMAKYFDVADALKEDIRVNGPRRVIVYKYSGGASFAFVRILPRR